MLLFYIFLLLLLSFNLLGEKVPLPREDDKIPPSKTISILINLVRPTPKDISKAYSKKYLIIKCIGKFMGNISICEINLHIILLNAGTKDLYIDIEIEMGVVWSSRTCFPNIEIEKRVIINQSV